MNNMENDMDHDMTKEFPNLDDKFEVSMDFEQLDNKIPTACKKLKIRDSCCCYGKKPVV